MQVNSVSVPADAVYGIAMHCPTNSGGKDWIGFVRSPKGGSNVIITFWGPKDRINSHAEKYGNSSDLSKIVNEKLNKGYTVVEEYTKQVDGIFDWASNYAQRIALKNAQTHLDAEARMAGKQAAKAPNIFKPKDAITAGIKPPEDAVGWDF